MHTNQLPDLPKPPTKGRVFANVFFVTYNAALLICALKGLLLTCPALALVVALWAVLGVFLGSFMMSMMILCFCLGLKEEPAQESRCCR